MPTVAVFLVLGAITFPCATAQRHEINVEVGREYLIENPGAPGESPSNLDTQWVLKSPGNTIILNCLELNIYKFDNVCKDYEFHVTGSEGSKVFCGNLHPFSERSMDTMTLRLTTGQWASGKLKCKVSAVEGDGFDTVKAHLRLNDNAVLIESPNYPKQPSAGSFKRWVLTADPGLKIGLTCTDIRFAGGANCQHYGLGLEINDGTKKIVTCDRGNFVTPAEPKMIVTYESETGSGSVACRAVAVKSGSFTDYYKELVFEEIDSSEHGVVARQRGTSCPCGWANREDSRIIGGRETLPNEYSFMVGLLYKEQHFCGGSILTQNFVLTAAHCTKPRDVNEIQVIVGAHNLIKGQESKWMNVHDVVEKKEHEHYNPQNSFIHDIAILRLKTPISFNEKVGPICLSTTMPSLNNQRIRAMGWGLTSKGASETLIKLDMTTLDPATCKSSMDYGLDQNNPSKVCFYANTKDTCNGDSGGPLVWLDPDTNRYTQVSLVSYGRGCASGEPSVGTNVSYYMDWIETNIGGPGCKKV